MSKSLSEYSKLSREQLISRIEKLEKLRKGKYGLVWEDKEEDLVKRCEVELPVLEEDISREIVTDTAGLYNFIIEGDNYHSLCILKFTHQEKIDVIYIDPPYNTGAHDWKYNNKYVDSVDNFRHSKWLSMMEKRLRLAHNLLSSTGSICVTIDDYEIGTLRILMDKIFGESNRLGLVTIEHNPRGRSDDKFFATCHEYALFYAKNISKVQTNKITLTDEQEKLFKFEDSDSKYRLLPLKRTGSNSTPKERPQLFFPIFVNTNTKEISLEEQFGNEWTKILPVDKNGNKRVWRWGKEKIEKEWQTEIFVKIKNKEISLFTKDRIKDGRKPKTIWCSPKYDASSHGTVLLEKILGKRKLFNYPKSIYAVLDTLKILTKHNKTAIVLDFFAGSGTTGHAVLELNKEDDGNRQFILCTNNENNICKEVTYPRIKAVIKGYADKAGIPANVKYYKQTFVPNVINDQGKRELVNKSTELLCMAENAFEQVSKRTTKNDFAIFKSDTKQIAIIYDEENIEKCVTKLNTLNSALKTVIYVFSYDHNYEKEDFSGLKINFSVKPIPEVILNIYRKIAKMRKK